MAEGLNRLTQATAVALTLGGAVQAQETTDDVVLAAMQEEASKLEMVVPHPDGEIVVDVTRVALDTQMEILTKLGACLQDGHDFADEDENGVVEGLEVHDFRDEGEWCAEEAQLAVRKADAEAGIAESDERIAAANVRQAEIQAEISALTQGLMEGIRAEGG